MRNFNLSEFDSPDLSGSGVKMDKEFLEMLDNARDIAGVPFKITSGYRTRAHNQVVGGVEGSSHCLGIACDIACSSSAHRFAIITSLLEAGFTRIGVASNFIHVDYDHNKVGQVIWTY
jgi:zinc D-Ala-D-Ala carboxypeptidase